MGTLSPCTLNNTAISLTRDLANFNFFLLFIFLVLLKAIIAKIKEWVGNKFQRGVYKF